MFGNIFIDYTPRDARTMKIILAPIMGITDRLYRTTFAQHFTGVDLAMAPFISTVQARRIKPAYLKDILPENNPSMPVIPQLLSNNPEDFLFLANTIFELGFKEINWNLGCPSPTVVNKKRGSGLLPFPDVIDQFLDHVIPRLTGKMSIKLRLGRYHAHEIEGLLPILNRYPLTELILHPRLGSQLYSGSVDLDAFAQVLSQTKHRVVYNGDINTVADFTDRCQRFPGIDSWMIGRGLLANPFLAAEIVSVQSPNVSDSPQGEISQSGEKPIQGQLSHHKSMLFNTIESTPTLKSDREMAILHTFHTALHNQYRDVLCGPSHLLARMKGFWGYFSENFTNPVKVRKQIYKTTSPDQYLEAVHHLFANGGLPL